MSLSYKVEDYRTTHFEVKDLTKIHGTPDIDSLILIFKELKRNSQKVPTSLGGGRLGYLALVVTPTVYATFPNSAPFVRPTHPGPFIPTSPRLTQVEVIREKAAHEERIRLTTECNAVEDALKKQLINAIPSVYTAALRDDSTDMIASSIPDIIAYLQREYCKLTPEEFNDRETELKSFVHDPENPVDLVFIKIADFKNLCDMTQRARTDSQLCEYAYLIFNRCGVFADYLITWNGKAVADKTYDNMKTHMRKAYSDLKGVGKLTVQKSNLNLMQEMKTHHEQLANDLSDRVANTVQANLMAALSNIEADRENIPPPQENHINAVQSNTALLHLIEQLQLKVDKLGQQMHASPYTCTPIVQEEINPKTGKPFKRYCWTCGCCNHWGKNHPGVKAPGHRDEATFKNRMGGSNKNCLGPK